MSPLRKERCAATKLLRNGGVQDVRLLTRSLTSVCCADCLNVGRVVHSSSAVCHAAQCQRRRHTMKPTPNRFRGMCALIMISALLASCGVIRVNMPGAPPATPSVSTPTVPSTSASTSTPAATVAIQPAPATASAPPVATPTPVLKHIVPLNITGSLLLEPSRSVLSLHVDG